MGEALPNTEIFRRLAQRLGFTEACFADSDEAIAAQAIIPGDARAAGISWESLKEQGWQKLALPAAPFAEGGFPTASGKCQFYSEPMARDGFDPLPDYVPQYEAPQTAPELAARYPLAMISPRLATSSTAPSSTSTACAPPRASRTWTSTRPTPPSAASCTARWCAPSMTAAAWWRAPASPTAPGAGWWWGCRSGGRSWPPTARTPTS